MKIAKRQLYEDNYQDSTPFGPLDSRLGVSEKGKICGTCGQSVSDCPGHVGYIKLELPVFHIGFFKHTLATLQAICKTCSRLLFKNEESRNKWLKKIRNKEHDRMQKDALLKGILKECKRPKECLACKTYNGTVKKLAGTIKIVHEKYEGKKGDNLNGLTEDFDHMIQTVSDFEAQITGKIHEDLNPVVAFKLLERVSEEDIELLGMDVNVSHPKDMILTHLIVPPVCIRPSVQVSQGVTNEDDLTVKLQEVVQLNDLIRKLLSEGAPLQKITQQWEYLQGTIALYINSETSGLPPDLSGGKAIRALCQRLKGKHGRFRGNLSGKRVDFSGRTVISPDPNLLISQVAVPELMAKVLTYPEQVNRYNINRLKTMVANGPDRYPGANYVRYRGGNKVYLQFGKRAEIAQSLAIGDVVERHMVDNDVILFNRQPSLHRISIMAHRAKIMPWRTLRFNECVCTPYNADFDGDEMNIHLPQTEEAKAEARVLMNVVDCIISPKAGDPIIAPTQDFLTCGFLLTRKNVFFDRTEFFRLAATIVDAKERIDVPRPAIIKPKELWTGKQLFSLILRPHASACKPVNLEGMEKTYTKKGEHLCPKDGWVIIQNSVLLCGNLTKSTLGAGSKEGIVSAIARDDSCLSATAFMSRLAKLTSRYLCDRGLSIGLEDVTPSLSLQHSKQDLIAKGYSTCDEIIQQWKNGRLPLKAGCNAEQTLESMMNGELSRIREKAGDVCRDELPPWNAPLIMAISGAKGSLLNMCQMIACVGQQSVNGHRIPDGFGNRSLPHFAVKARDPAAKGFVQNSFYSGLSPTEFFFHTMGGREGLVDSAVKTAETGYMQRRLMKALEDLSVKYDYSVRTSSNDIAEFVYGDDALEPMRMEEKMQPVNYAKLLNYAKQVYRRKSASLLPEEIERLADRELSRIDGRNVPSFDVFCTNTRAFIQKIVKDDPDLRTRLSEAVNSKPMKHHSDQKSPDEKAAEKKAAAMKAAEMIEDLGEAQLIGFIALCWNRYERALVSPGEAVGAVAAQSIGEPGTQMTLKTFHFAGVASMNITLGVPRIKEIINAVKDISTPIITAYLENPKSEISAQAVKGRVEKTRLKDICRYVEEVYSPQGCHLCFRLNLATIEALQLEVSLAAIKRAIITWPKLKLKDEHITITEPDFIRIESPESSRERLYFNLQELMAAVPAVIVKGIKAVERAVISQDSKTRDYSLLVEGYGLADVMATPGVDFRRCTTNHVMETEKVLGIEAARECIIHEIKFTLNEHGITVDSRHIMLLADVMTCKGMILGITRFGVSKMKESTLMLASFEKTTDHLFDASMRGVEDSISGVSECIIMGNRVPLGTGMFKVLMDVRSQAPSRLPEKRKPLILA